MTSLMGILLSRSPSELQDLATAWSLSVHLGNDPLAVTLYRHIARPFALLAFINGLPTEERMLINSVAASRKARISRRQLQQNLPFDDQLLDRALGMLRGSALLTVHGQFVAIPDDLRRLVRALTTQHGAIEPTLRTSLKQGLRQGALENPPTLITPSTWPQVTRRARVAPVSRTVQGTTGSLGPLDWGDARHQAGPLGRYCRHFGCLPESTDRALSLEWRNIGQSGQVGAVFRWWLSEKRLLGGTGTAIKEHRLRQRFCKTLKEMGADEWRHFHGHRSLDKSKAASDSTISARVFHDLCDLGLIDLGLDANNALAAFRLTQVGVDVVSALSNRAMARKAGSSGI